MKKKPSKPKNAETSKEKDKLPANSWKIKYTPDMCQKLLEHRKKGRTMESFVAVAGVTKQTLDNWRKNYPEFAEAWEIGFGHAHLWWEDFGIKACLHKNFQASWAMFLSRNMIGYKNLDYRKGAEVEDANKQISAEERQKKIKELQEQIARFNRKKA